MYAKIAKSTIKKIAIVKTDCKKTLAQVVAQQKCDYAINGGLYDMKTGEVNPIPLRIDGKTIATSTDGYWMMVWNTGPDLCMAHSKDMSKWKNAVTCATMLKDGTDTCFIYTPAQGGIRGRTAFGDDDKNAYLWVTTDKSGALSPTALRTQMRNIGAKNAVMLDCGGSSQMYSNGTYVQAEKRKVSYWICVWLNESDKKNTTIKCPYAEPILTIKSGSKGTGAKWVQWHLNAIMSAGLTVDGAFGAKSVTALKNFQRKYGLTVDGLCGKATRQKLKESL